jgi:chemotaxis protein MotB
MRRRKKEEEEASTERWLVSYADFITLLFAFFTTLYAISTVDVEKMGKMVTSMQASFDHNLFDAGSRRLTLNPGAGQNPSYREMLKSVDLRNGAAKDPDLKQLQEMKQSSKEVVSGEKALAQLKTSVESLLSAEVLKGRVRTYIDSRGLIISLGEGGVFDSGSDQIKPEGKELLNKIALSLSSVANQLRVEGHTDNVPISNSRFPSNWELSTGRATQMLRYLIAEFSFQPELVSAAGYGEYRPAASNDTDEGRACNRRVDIVVLNPIAAQAEPK